MESDNKFENDTGGMSVDEIIADIDRKTANAEALEENSVGITPEGENEMSDEQVAVSADEADTAAGHIPVDDESTIDELSGVDEMSDGQEALEEKSAELAEEANVDATAKTEKKPNFFYRLVRGIIPWKGDDTGLVIRKIIFIVAFIVFLATAIPLLADILSMYKDEQVSKGISQMYQLDANTDVPENNKDILPSFKKLLEINPDTVGYIKIDGTLVDYPVVKGTDNDYYLTHDFYKNESRSGTVMMDYRNKVTADGHSGNLVLYGHNMAVGTFFAPLNEYWRTMYDSYDEPSKSFYKEHPVIRFDTLYEQAEWKVFGFGIFNVAESRGEVYEYNQKLDFTSEDDFNDYIINIMDRSDIFTDVDLKYGDDILTLSTCCWPYEGSGDTVRLAIFARKIRKGESDSVDVEKAVGNPYVRRWQWVYDKVSGGYDWFQSTWPARWVIVIALIWRWTGYNMVFYLAGLQNIDYSVYEASYIDGATPFQQFMKITIPLLKPTILMTAIMSTSGTLQLFDESMNLTAGGPGKSTMTLAHYIYNISFVETPKFNYAAALSVCILVMVAVLSAIQMKVGDKRD